MKPKFCSVRQCITLKTTIRKKVTFFSLSEVVGPFLALIFSYGMFRAETHQNDARTNIILLPKL